MNRTFKDNEGRTWTPKATLFEAARLKRNLDVNIEDADDVLKVIQDVALFCDVLYTCCETEANGRNISSEDFGRALAGDSIKEARGALLVAISDFFEDSQKRTAFTGLIKTLQEEGDKLTDLLMKKSDVATESIRKECRTFRRALEAELDKAMTSKENGKTKTKDSGKPSTGQQES